jgi:signal transduction histidine kinase
VLANLIINAAHAIGQRWHRELGRIAVRSHYDAARDCVQVSIQDNGAGILREHQDRVFDPFFTTKAVGHGTGQGLTISRNVVTRHGGSLTFESEVSVGTTFVLTLPVKSERERQ